MAKTVLKHRNRSSANIHGSSWAAPNCSSWVPGSVVLWDINHPALTSWMQPQGGTICAHSWCRGICGEICCWRWWESGPSNTGCWVKPRAGCGNYINQLIIPLPEPLVHSLVSELRFFAFLQSSWRWDVEHGVLLLLMVLKKNITSAGWHVLIVCEGKMSARFGAGKTFLQIRLAEVVGGEKQGSRELREH